MLRPPTLRRDGHTPFRIIKRILIIYYKKNFPECPTTRRILVHYTIMYARSECILLYSKSFQRLPAATFEL